MTTLSGLSPSQKAAVRFALTIANPRKAIQQLFADDETGANEPVSLMGYEDPEPESDWIHVAPGAMSDQSLWPPGDLEGFYNERTSIRADIQYVGEARDHQSRSVALMDANVSGYTVSPCGSGKTEMGIQLAARLGMTCLVIVDTKDLARQWVRRFQKRSNVTPVLFGGGRKKLPAGAAVVVATVQALACNMAWLWKLAEWASVALIDEAHVVPSFQFVGVMRVIKPARRYGFTATPDRADGTIKLLEWWVGPRLATVEQAELEAAGLVVRPKVQVIPTSFRISYEISKAGLSRRKKYLLENAERNWFITNWIEATYAQNGGFHLVLSDSTQHLLRLRALLDFGFGSKMDLIHGKLTTRRRADILERAEDGEIRVLLATTLADKGLDLPGLTDIWLTCPTGSKALVTQRFGRSTRVAEGKTEAWIHDFVDDLVYREYARDDGTPAVAHCYLSHFRERLTAYRGKVDIANPRVVDWILSGRKGPQP